MLSIRALILDMDGVLWRGDQPVVDLPEAFNRIKSRGWKILLMTNNSTRSVDEYLDKLGSFGVFLDPSQVLTSAEATAHYLLHQFPEKGPIYVVGEKSLELVLAESGFPHYDHHVLAVVIGMDRTLTYEKLRRAALLIRSGVPMIATNTDRTFPTPEGLVPGAGAIVGALEISTDRRATVTGKPNPQMFHAALDRLGTSPSETLVVGDRLETDIAGAQALSMPTALVLSGVTLRKAANAWSPPLDFIAADLDELLNMLDGSY